MSQMPTRELGRTGERVSALGLGGWHLSLPTVSARLAERIVRTAVDRGLTFLDNSWDYNAGASERRMGHALRDGYRQKVFLMTKIDGRSGAAATRQLHDSLRRLGTDCLDLVQHHEILRFEDPDRVFHPEGAQAALEAARKAGKLRFIGFTGHKNPHVHLHMLDVAKARGYRFDTVQMPLNLMDAHFRSFGRLVLPRLVRERIGVLGMKPIANGIILKSKTVSAVDCLRYALTLPTSVVITGIDSMRVLNQALAVAESFTPLSTATRRALLAKTAHAARTGAFEPFKTSSIFDGTASHPEWLGQEPRRLQALMPD
jgi:aryl-alcohol dehydrogenase-like predicted oxidoreductase